MVPSVPVNPTLAAGAARLAGKTGPAAGGDRPGDAAVDALDGYVSGIAPGRGCGRIQLPPPSGDGSGDCHAAGRSQGDVATGAAGLATGVDGPGSQQGRRLVGDIDAACCAADDGTGCGTSARGEGARSQGTGRRRIVGDGDAARVAAGCRGPSPLPPLAARSPVTKVPLLVTLITPPLPPA